MLCLTSARIYKRIKEGLHIKFGFYLWPGLWCLLCLWRFFSHLVMGCFLHMSLLLPFYPFTSVLSFWAKLEIKSYGLTASHSRFMNNVHSWCSVGSCSDLFCVQCHSMRFTLEPGCHPILLIENWDLESLFAKDKRPQCTQHITAPFSYVTLISKSKVTNF